MTTAQPEPTSLDAPAWLLLIGGGVSLLNAFWMFVAPLHWYHELPAGVPDFGAFNPHFVRDIGCAFATAGAAQIVAALRPLWRTPLTAFSALFLVLHALLHIHDTARGLVDAHHWWLDIPGVYLPALVFGALAWRMLRADRAC